MEVRRGFVNRRPTFSGKVGLFLQAMRERMSLKDRRVIIAVG
jgi:hypothetical protein